MFSAFLKGDNFCDLFLSPVAKLCRKKPTLKEKNLLLVEQILSFKSKPPLIREIKQT